MYQNLTFQTILFRCVLAVSIGALIGKERGTKINQQELERIV